MTALSHTHGVASGTTPVSSNSPQPLNRHRYTAWAVLVTGLVITAFATLYIKSNVEGTARRDFLVRCEEIHNVIENRLNVHARILLSGVALFDASENVTRAEWHVFAKTQKIEKSLPSIQGIGFSLFIPRGELSRHIHQIRSERFPEYRVKPEGDREVYTSIVYLEPFSGRNLQALGYDMLSDAVFRKAMEEACDADTAVLSGKTLLVQEAGKDAQPGVLMYAPVYRKDMPTDSAAERRAAIYGWVYSSLRMNRLMRETLAGRNLEKSEKMHLQIFDGATPSAQSLLYQCHSREEKPYGSHARFTRQTLIDFNDHRWTLWFEETGDETMIMEYIEVWSILVGGTLITLLLFMLIRTLLNTRAHAQRMAEELTVGLRESEKSLKRSQELAHLGSWDMDLVNDRLTWSEEGYRIFGLSPQEFSGTYEAFLDIVHPDDRAAVDAAYSGSLREGREGYEIEHRIIKKSTGEVRFVYEKCHHGKDASGKIVRSTGMVQDITERKQAEEAAAKLSAAKSKFTSTVSHELRSPLATIKEATELVLDGLLGPVNDEQKHVLDTAKENISRLGRLVNNVLVYQKMEAGKTYYTLQANDMNEVIREVLKSAALFAGNRTADLVMDLGDDLPKISFDRDKLFQVMINLMANAVKYSESGNIVIRTRREDRRIHVSVRDSGPGIKPEHLNEIFEPFSQMGDSSQGGTGLGLAIAKEIIRAHHGKIWVESEIGRGSAFHFTLPL
ncbi:MAG: CHASE domain-containing protein [Candidatus Omnitrophota bacterium]